MKIVNLTLHAVTVMPKVGESVTFESSGTMARVREISEALPALATEAGSVPMQAVSYADQIDGLPEPVPEVLYLVSRITAAAAQHRDDLVFPHQELRDPDNGQIIGCAALGRFTGDRERDHA